MNYLVDFAAIDWASPMLGVRHKIHRVDGRQLRLVEYSRDMAPHWCERSHVGQILDGHLQVEFTQKTQVFTTGDAVFIPPGPMHAHRANPLTQTVTALFVEDGD